MQLGIITAEKIPAENKIMNQISDNTTINSTVTCPKTKINVDNTYGDYLATIYGTSRTGKGAKISMVQLRMPAKESFTDAGLRAASIAKCLYFCALNLRVKGSIPARAHYFNWESIYRSCPCAGLAIADGRLALVAPG